MVDIEKYQDGSSKIICKVTDFGFAKAMDSFGKETMALGTPSYMAPEIVSRSSYDKSVDIWAIGVIVYIMLTGKTPFGGKAHTKADMYNAILNNPLDLQPLDRYFKNGQLLKNFVSQCINKDPAKRPTAN